MPKKQKIILTVATLLVTGLLATGLFGVLKVSQKTNQESPNPEQLAELIKPAVVRIVQHVTGDVSIPTVDFKLEDLTISVARENPSQTPIDEYFTGTGFVVNPDGYILTNAHVASPEILKSLLIDQVLQELVKRKTDGLSNQQLAGYFHDVATVNEFKQRLQDALEQNSVFNIQSKLAVLNPSSPLEDLTALMKDGFPAETVALHENFLADQKDVALIKIAQNNLPSLSLGNSEDLGPGQKIYVFGFPSTAEFNQKTPLESTFTQGIVSAIKFSQNKDFKIFQTDAKMSQGSSGGPLFNEKGQVVGIITFETGELEKDSGDNFAFAIPISLAKQTMAEKLVQNNAGDYEEHFKKGLSYFKTNQCKNAVEEFTIASKVNKNFAADKYINPYLEECQLKISSGQSVDGRFALARVWLSEVTSFVWFVVVGRIVLILLGIWVVWELVQRMRRDEKEIGEISTSLEEEKDLAHQLVKQLKHEEETKAPHEPEPAHPHVVQYVREAREVGLPDDHITTELKKGGWEDHEIKRAL